MTINIDLNDDNKHIHTSTSMSLFCVHACIMYLMINGVCQCVTHS